MVFLTLGRSVRGMAGRSCVPQRGTVAVEEFGVEGEFTAARPK